MNLLFSFIPDLLSLALWDEQHLRDNTFNLKNLHFHFWETQSYPCDYYLWDYL